MFSQFYLGVQQDFKIFLIAPILCALLRAVFILTFNPYGNFAGKGNALAESFYYRFWWGMKYNAYVFLFCMLFVSIPGAFIPDYFAIGDTVRLVGTSIYCFVIYVAFCGKMAFFTHFRQIFNKTLWLGMSDAKSEFVRIFFRESHGVALVLGTIPVMYFVWNGGKWLLSTHCAQLFDVGLFFTDNSSIYGDVPLLLQCMQYGFNFMIAVVAAMLFLYVQSGATFVKDLRPSWDGIPAITKKESFLAMATVDDLIALNDARRRPLARLMMHSDEEDEKKISRIMPDKFAHGHWKKLSDPTAAFARTAKGAHIRKPKNIFFFVVDSFSEFVFDDIYKDLHIADRAKAFRNEKNTVSFKNFLPAGITVRESLASIMSGLFDSGISLNENNGFWRGATHTSLPRQIGRLGYKTYYWEGGNAGRGSFNLFAPGAGFDVVMSASEFCPNDAPHTYNGVCDDVFFQKIANELNDISHPAFHMIHTTSNHAPFNIPMEQFGFFPKRTMPEVLKRMKIDSKTSQMLGTFWYEDRCLNGFIREMLKRYPDSLIVVTGDHPALPVPFGTGLIARLEPTYREQYGTSFYMHHRDFELKSFAGNTIGSHMNIMPTIIELIAPRGYEYYSIAQSLTEPVEHVVTPHNWMTDDAIGHADDGLWQKMIISADQIDVNEGSARFSAEIDGLQSLSGWMARHPESLS